MARFNLNRLFNDSCIEHFLLGSAWLLWRTTQIYGAELAAFRSVNDTITGGTDGDTFRFEMVVNAKDEIIAKHVNADGTIDWVGVTGESINVHDHWIDGLDTD